jgi:hypothetical protein
MTRHATKDPQTGRFVRAADVHPAPVLHREPITQWHVQEDRNQRWLVRFILLGILAVLGLTVLLLAALERGL